MQLPVDAPRPVMIGYSDRINHALAFALKHHDQQVRRGTRPPYNTQSANLAVMLTRYGADEETVVAGILLDTVEDYGREAFSTEVLANRIGDKFGARVLEIALMAAERRVSDDGRELSADQRHDDLLNRLRQAAPEGRMLAAAKGLHGAGTLLADVQRTVDPGAVWARVTGGRSRALDRYRRLHDVLRDSGLSSPIVEELRSTIDSLEATPSPA